MKFLKFHTNLNFFQSGIFWIVNCLTQLILFQLTEVYPLKWFKIFKLIFCNKDTPYILTSDQISHSVVSNSLRPHESKPARPPCPSPTPGVHSNSRPSSQWCHPAISSSVVPFSSCPQSLPASVSLKKKKKNQLSGATVYQFCLLPADGTKDCTKKFSSGVELSSSFMSEQSWKIRVFSLNK